MLIRASNICVPAQEDGRAAGQAARGERAEADRVARKVYWGLLPLLTIMGVFIYLDRSNLSFISGQIIPALGLTSTDYGLGSGALSVSHQVGKEQVCVHVCIWCA